MNLLKKLLWSTFVFFAGAIVHRFYHYIACYPGWGDPQICVPL
jgi:hypothetical protein